MCESSSEAAAVYRYSSFALQFGVKPYSTPAPSVAPTRLLEPEHLSSPGRPPMMPNVPQVSPLSVVKLVLAPSTATPNVAKNSQLSRAYPTRVRAVRSQLILVVALTVKPDGTPKIDGVRT